MRHLLTVAALAVLGLLTGCGMSADEDLSRRVEGLAEGLRQNLESDSSYDVVRAVECYDPDNEPVHCIAYFPVADDVALTAEYTLRSGNASGHAGLYDARLVDAHEQLTVPSRTYDVSVVDLL